MRAVATARGLVERDDAEAPVAPKEPKGHVIVVSSQKGGTGKSTIAIHLAVSLLRRPSSVHTIDLDSEQGSLTRYVENRRAYAARTGADLPIPRHVAISPSVLKDRDAARADELERLGAVVAHAAAAHDFVVVDTAGSAAFLARVAHEFADTIVTPLNDSLLDLDVLALVDPETRRVVRGSAYTGLVIDAIANRRARGQGETAWIVVRNRLTMLDSRNKRQMLELVELLSREMGFRIAAGIGERVVFRELFLDGLTLLDLRDADAGVSLNMSHLAARQEFALLLEALDLPRRSAPARTG